MALWHLGDNHTADIVVLVDKGQQADVLLIQRRFAPFQGCWALPGGFVNSLTPAGQFFQFAESYAQAAVRELAEETTIDINEADLSLVGTYDAWGRDPRAESNQRVVTQCFLYRCDERPVVVAGDDAGAVGWFKLADVLAGKPNLAFDHLDMLQAVQQRIEDTHS